VGRNRGTLGWVWVRIKTWIIFYASIIITVGVGNPQNFETHHSLLGQTD
jgi:hypothetical protein